MEGLERDRKYMCLNIAMFYLLLVKYLFIFVVKVRFNVIIKIYWSQLYLFWFSLRIPSEKRLSAVCITSLPHTIFLIRAALFQPFRYRRF